MNVNFEAIEKAWFKPKKNVLDELEEWVLEDNDCFETTFYMGRCVNYKDILNKIQELKKENENDK